MFELARLWVLTHEMNSKLASLAAPYSLGKGSFWPGDQVRTTFHFFLGGKVDALGFAPRALRMDVVMGLVCLVVSYVRLVIKGHLCPWGFVLACSCM